MPKMHVDRQWTIRAEAGKVFDVIADYGTWTTWSPWLCADKGASVTVSDPANQVGSTYAWDGDVVGAGSMTHTQLKTPDEIVAKLEFTKPFKSTSQVTFKIRPQGDATVVEWHMDGNWPWFLFWMKGMMETLIGMDYQRGLMMLGDWIETGKIESDTEVLGVVDVPDRTVHGVSNQVAMADVGESMAKDFHRVGEMDACVLEKEMISIYHKLDMKNQRFDYTSGGVVDATKAASGGIHVCKLPAGKALHIRHTGRYEHLGNAWSTGYQVARYRKLKLRGKDAFEIYRNSPETTAPADLITDVYLPLK